MLNRILSQIMRAPATAFAIIFTLSLQSHASAFATSNNANAHRHAAGKSWTIIKDESTFIILSSRQLYTTTCGVSSSTTRCDVVRRDLRTKFHVMPQQQLGSFEKLTDVGEDNTMQSREKRRVWLYDFVSTPKLLTHDQPSTRSTTVPYYEAWELQKQLVQHQLSRIGKRPSDPPLHSQFLPSQFEYDDEYTTMNTKSNAGSIGPPPNLIGCDSILVLQHDPVYTLGTASDPSYIRQDENPNDKEENNRATTPIPTVRIERGGEVTYHGPGQLTIYPILDLRGYKQDVHWYMRALEEVILLALKNAGVKGATREENLTGVWVSNKKIAALGIKARRWVTMHGFAINVDIRSLQNFEGIVPCGLVGREVTCVNKEIGDSVSAGFTVEEFSHHVKEALEEIFCVTLIPRE